MDPLTATQLVVAAQPLQYEATGGRSGISERLAAVGRANAGVAKTGNRAKGEKRGLAKGKAAKGEKRGPAKGNKAKGVANTGNAAKGKKRGPAKGNAAKGKPKKGDAAKGVAKKGNKAKGVTHTGESVEDLFRRMKDLPKG